jgi:hypothetical protein
MASTALSEKMHRFKAKHKNIFKVKRSMFSAKVIAAFMSSASVCQGSDKPGNTKGESITILLISCLTGLESAV